MEEAVPFSWSGLGFREVDEDALSTRGPLERAGARVDGRNPLLMHVCSPTLRGDS